MKKRFPAEGWDADGMVRRKETLLLGKPKK